MSEVISSLRQVIWNTLQNSQDVTYLDKSEDVIKESKLDYEVDTCEVYAGVEVINPERELGEDDAIACIKKKDIPALYKKLKEVPHRVATYRKDNNVVFDVLSDRYTVVQNVEAFKFFDHIVDKGLASYHRAGYIGKGEEIFVIAKYNKDIIVSDDDVVESYLLLTSSHDGKSSIKVRLIPTRIACANQLTGILSGSVMSIRHSSKSEDRLKDAEKVITMFDTSFEAMQSLYRKMYNTKVEETKLQQMLYEVYCTKDELTEIKKGTLEVNEILSTKKMNMINEIIGYYHYHPTQQGIQGTYWGLYNAVTGYYQNVKEHKDTDKQFKSTFNGDISTKIQKLFDNIKHELTIK